MSLRLSAQNLHLSLYVIDAKIIDLKEGKADSAIIMLHGRQRRIGLNTQRRTSACGAPVEQARLILPTAPERAITANKGFLMRGWFDLLDTDGIGASDEPALVESARYCRAFNCLGRDERH
ncbi:MAG: hypothetical protein ACLRRK_06560 [Parasutterella sp.]